ncbi:hypothetical protein [Ralstonia pseudosolanacearum]|uniref:hypothetical protein n=1 Tax=Ralstonia pseudosolanacearum TaxID=1310165 RepID=UPI003CF09E75
MKIHDYLRGEASEQRARYAAPVLAIDVIAAKSRAETLELLAEEIADKDDEDALAHLISVRELACGRVSYDTSMALVLSLGEFTWFQGVVDRVSREPVGWIEVSGTGYDGRKRLHLPRYRRMLGINNCADAIARERGESDAEWLSRRVAWLGQYHPQVRVAHASKRCKAWMDESGLSEEIVFGDVESFLGVEHLLETELVATRGFSFSQGVEYDVLDVYTKPDAKGSMGRIRQRSGVQQPLGLVELHDYRLEVVV